MCLSSGSSFFLTNKLYFIRGILDSKQNWTESRVPSTVCPHILISLLLASLTTVIQLLQLMSLHWQHCHSTSIVFLKVHSWCCSFYGFWEMYNNIYLPLLQYHTCPKSLLFCLFTLLYFLDWAGPNLYYCRSFAFSKHHINGIM